MLRMKLMNDPATSIGNNCDIHPSAVIGADVTVSNGVSIGPGVIINGRCVIGEGCQIAAGSVLDSSTECADSELVLENGVHVLAGTTIAAPVRISEGARVQPGSVVQRDVPPHAIVSGNPAQIIGYTLSMGEGSQLPAPVAMRKPGSSETLVRGVTLHHFPRILDLRGNLSVGEFGRTVPFDPKRYFLVFGVPNAEVRGEHAHRSCKQFLICTSGSCSVVADDGVRRQEFLLDDPSIGLYLPAMTWGIQYKYSIDAVLLVFASEYYSSEEYIRDYDEFRSLSLALPKE